MRTIVYSDLDNTAGVWKILDPQLKHLDLDTVQKMEEWFISNNAKLVKSATNTYGHDIVFETDEDAVVFKLKYGV